MREYPENRDRLAGKQAVATEYKTPDEIPSLRGKYSASLDYPGAVTKSCMHCHQIRDGARQVYRDAGEPVPDQLLFPNPLPDVIGLEFDPEQSATISRVTPGSAAATAGFLPGDKLSTLKDQPVISLADVQWILHNAGASDALEAVVVRSGEKHMLTLMLANGWRRDADISWRVSSWPLRRMGTGGLLLEAASASQRRDAGIGNDKLALVVKHVGQYGPHAAAKKAGFKKADIVISFDGQSDNMSPSQLLAYAAQKTKPGQQVPVVIVRDGTRASLSLPMQE